MKNNLKLFFTIFLCYIPVFIAFACSMPQIDISTNTQDALIRAGARRAGERFYYNNPDQAELAISHCNTILEAKDPQAIVVEALTHLTDPFLVEDIADLISLVKIDMAGNMWEREKLLIAVSEFKRGIEMAMEMPEFRRKGDTIEHSYIVIPASPLWDEDILKVEAGYDCIQSGECGFLVDYPPIHAVLPPLPPGMFNDDYFIDMGM